MEEINLVQGEEQEVQKEEIAAWVVAVWAVTTIVTNSCDPWKMGPIAVSLEPRKPWPWPLLSAVHQLPSWPPTDLNINLSQKSTQNIPNNV